MTINQTLNASGNPGGVERQIEDMPENIQRILKVGKRLMRDWFDAWVPVSEADRDWNFGKKNPNNNNFKKKALRGKLQKAREAVELAGFKARTSNQRPSCAILNVNERPELGINAEMLFPEYTAIVIGQFDADFGSWNDDGEFQKAFTINF